MTSRDASFLFTVAAFFLLFSVGTLFASGTAKVKPGPPPEDKRVLVSAVNAANNQIIIIRMINGQKETYTVDDLTQITIDNTNGAALKDIRVGQEVFSYIERDSQTLDSIVVGRADPAPSAK